MYVGVGREDSKYKIQKVSISSAKLLVVCVFIYARIKGGVSVLQRPSNTER